MIELVFKDGSKKEFEIGITADEIVSNISKSLRKETVGAKLNGIVIGLMDPIRESGDITFLNKEDQEAFALLNHSSAHLMAQAIKQLWPDAKFGVGPSIENGFYYDVDVEPKIVEADLVRIEKEMKRLVANGQKIERHEKSKADALEFFKEDPYKVELISGLDDGTITFYQQGEFVDLCRGPHVFKTSEIKHFKLLSLAGAYWRGDSKNKQLQRIYGVSYYTKEDLDAYLNFLVEVEKRDHRRLGKDLELFYMSEYGPGFPFFLPKGMIVKNILVDLWRKEHRKAGYEEISTPIMLDKELWELSGHWFNYRENMYTSEIDEKEFAIKPMNCPGSLLTYNNGLHSYRDLPIRMGELGIVHRHEFSGALHGLFRVRSFTQDDAHLFMRPDQAVDEIIGIMELIDRFYKQIFGFDYYVELSTKPEKAIGSDEIWDYAEGVLADAMHKIGVPYTVNEGDGAFYGPKLDFKIKDALGRPWQCGTIQIDFNLPERFDVNYIGEDGKKHRPVVLHRVVYGSLERFMGILIEHYAGAFPVWLAPEQARIIPVSLEAHKAYADTLFAKLEDAGIRTSIDSREEKMGYKIRQAQVQKIPFQLVLGDEEVSSQTVMYRRYGSQDQVSVTIDEFIALVQEESKIG